MQSAVTIPLPATTPSTAGDGFGLPLFDLSRMRRCSSIVLLGFALAGCELESFLAREESPGGAQAFQAYVLDFWGAGDVSALRRALHPDMVYHFNGLTVPGDAASHLSYLEGFGGAFSDLDVTIDVLTFDGSVGGAATHWSGTHTAALCGAEPTGESLAWAVNYVFRVEDGLIVELWETWDEGALFQAIGATPDAC